jgi:CRP-like cAMP-binding protein
MMPGQPYNGNYYLLGLSASEYGLLRLQLTSFDLRVGDRLHDVGKGVDEVVFPHSGLVALTVSLPDGVGATVAFVGRDGIVGGFSAAAWVPATCDAEVHIAGRASRMSAAAFRYVLEQNPAMRYLAARFDSATIAQTQQTALCNAAHSVEARVCRRLLEVQDRSDDSRITLTQNSLARMLGVRRTTVTLVVGRLEALGAISCRRGYMEVRSREELERHSCECYKHVQNYVGSLFPSAARRSAVSAAAAAPLAGA